MPTLSACFKLVNFINRGNLKNPEFLQQMVSPDTEAQIGYQFMFRSPKQRVRAVRDN